MPRAKYAGDATVDMLINTETDDTILGIAPGNVEIGGAALLALSR